MRRWLRENAAFTSGFVLLVFVGVLLTGCSATQTKTLAGYAEGRADEARQAEDARARARREAAKRVHCRTSLTDFYALTKADRKQYAAYCGYE